MCSVFAELWVVDVDIEPLWNIQTNSHAVGKYLKSSPFKSEHYVDHIPPLVLIKKMLPKTFPPWVLWDDLSIFQTFLYFLSAEWNTTSEV